MAIIKVLKRRDAASVIVAIVIGMALLQFVSTVTGGLAGKITGLEEGQYVPYSFPGVGWKGTYLLPVVSLALQLVALEVTIWVYTLVHNLVSKKR